MRPHYMRLALRAEGNFWNAYAALADTMDGAVLLGSIAIGAVTDNERRRRSFMDLMKSVLADYIKDATGAAPKWNPPDRAPEHERAGRG